MSLCLCVLHKNAILISGDSRGCYLSEDNKTKFTATDDCQKIYKINDKVMFISGIYALMTSIIENFKKSDNQSIEKLEKISQNLYDAWKILHPDMIDCGNGRAGAIVVATFENGKGVLYVLDSSVNNWKAERYEGENYLIPATLGSHAPEALADLRYQIKQPSNIYIKNNTIDFCNMFYDIYSKYADNQMGGFMHYYALSPKTIITKEPVMIPDSKEIKRINLKM
jgi:hypothetical protein